MANTYHGPIRQVKSAARVGLYLPIGEKHKQAIDGERCRKSLRHYIKTFWKVADTAHPYIDAPHIHAMADHLQAVDEGEIQRLGITVPPGHAKSLITSVLFPSWQWTRKPDIQSLFFSYDPSLATRDSIRCRMIIESDEYQNTFNPDWQFRSDQNEKTYYVNTRLGSRYSFGLYSTKKTGWRGDQIVIDDPLSIDDRYDNNIKAECINIADNVLTSRVHNKETARWIVIMQRLAENDLIGHFRKKSGWEILTLATEFEPKKRYFTKIGWTDPRTQEKELLFPQLFPQSVIDRTKTEELTPNDFSSQHQQEPVQEGGARFLDRWFGRWSYTDHTCHFIKLWNSITQKEDVVPFGQCSFFVSIDSAVGEKRANDYTVYVIWGKLPDGRLIIVERFKDRMTEPESINLALSLMKNQKYGGRPLSYFAIEVNGVGKPLAQNIERKSIPVVSINVHQDKLAMSTSAVVLYASGRVHHPVRAEWLLDFEKDLTEFPFGDHDDTVSSISIGAESLSIGFGNIQSSKTIVPEKRHSDDQTNMNGSQRSDTIKPNQDSGRKIFGITRR